MQKHAITKFALTLTTTIAGFLLGATAAVAQENLTLAPKTSHSIAIPEGIKRIIISDPTVITAQPDASGRAVLLQALKSGLSELRIERLVGDEYLANVNVIQDVGPIYSQIRELLKDIEGLEIRLIGNKIIFSGEVLTKDDWDLKETVKNAFTSVILDTSKMSNVGDKFLADKITREIGLKNVNARVSEGTCFLEGAVYNASHVDRATRIAQTYVVNVINLIKVQEIMIETDVHFVEVTGSAAKSFGNNILKNFSVDATGGVTGGSGAASASSFSLTANLSARINALVGKGDAKVLAKPHLSTKSGETGSFHSGGEIFIPVAGNVSGDLKTIQFGVILSVKPTLRSETQVLNEVRIEVSVPNADSQGVISLDKFETQSTTLTEVGQSVIISGLVQSLENQFREKTPLLGDIPLLKEFFSERSKRTDHKELVVILTPRPVFPRADNNPAFSEQRRHLLEK